MFVMLVGAWLLIQQHCCVFGDAGRARGPVLIDPLMRRSPLEKNFMRFGRSDPSLQSQGFFRETKGNDNFMRFGRLSPPYLSKEQYTFPKNVADILLTANKMKDNEIDLDGDDATYVRTLRDKSNFMRFGRDKDTYVDKIEEDMSKRAYASDNFMRFGRAREDESDMSNWSPEFAMFSRDERDKNNFMRFGRNRDNFMRFGRDGDRFVRTEKGKQDNFIRFGRSEKGEDCDDEGETRSGNSLRLGRSSEERLDREIRDKELVRAGRQRQSEKGTGFIRFGRAKRELEKSSCKKACAEDCPPEGCNHLVLPYPPPVYQPSLYGLLPNFLVAPELSLLPPPSTKSKRAKSNNRNFIRLG